MLMQSVKKAVLSALLGACSVMAPAAWSAAPSNVLLNPFDSNTFVSLPSDVKSPEGIAYIPTTRSIIVGTLNVGAANFILRYGTNGKLQAKLPVSAAGTISMTFNPRDNKVYFVSPGDLIGGTPLIQRVDVNFTASTPVETVAVIPDIGAPLPVNQAGPAGVPIAIAYPDNIPLPNGLAFRASDGALLVADSFQYAIFQIPNPAAATCPNDSSCVSVLKQDAQLASAAPPMLGANSILLSPDESFAYITNTGDDTVLTLNFATGALSVFANSIQGADGLAFGPDNTLLVSAFLGSEVVVLDRTPDAAGFGRVLAKLGGFRGLDKRGMAKGLLNNGSIAVNGNVVYATNLAMVGADPASVDVKVYSVSKIFLPRRFSR